MKKSLFIAALVSLFSLANAQQPDAIYKLLRYEWTVNADGTSDYHYRHEVQILRNRALTAYADKGETFVVYNPDLEEVTINEVYTLQLDGTRIDMPQNAFIYQLPSECADCGPSTTCANWPWCTPAWNWDAPSWSTTPSTAATTSCTKPSPCSASAPSRNSRLL